MLKRLELIGFKSFADRTRFDFPAGITAVVGPNGSGKSNIVDAVRWLLGEQSAKNLRGGEMTDVIFNGSTTRKSLGMAEVTMTFDNTSKVLNADEGEVQVTRRVFRDGEGEYQINGRPVRLKDVKDLFLGSGAGHGAYSIIEQGRVDALLAASTKDRRLIFEEAAGISRFKAKKIETQRKLERVDADLVRVRDILAELDKQLRTLRLQAAKAERYLEYTARLKFLRVGLGRGEYRHLSAALAREEAALADLRAELADVSARAATGETELRELDWDLSRTLDTLRHQEARLADARQQIATQEAVVKSERAQAANLEAEGLRLSKQRAELGQRLKALEADATKAAADLAAATAAVAAGQGAADAASEALASVTSLIAGLNRQAESDRAAQFDLVGRASKLHNEAETTKAEAARLSRELTRKRAEMDAAAARFRAVDAALGDLSRTDADVQQRLAAARQSLLDHTAARDRLRAEADALQADLDAHREQRGALRGRADVLEGLEQGLEGFGAGVREVVGRLHAGDPPLSAAVIGLVADLLTVPRAYAPLIDLALGDLAQRFVVRSDAGLDILLESLGDLPGRVGFVPLLGEAPGSPDGFAPRTAASVVRCDYPALAAQLLGRVLLAPDRAAARDLARQYPGFRVLARDGSVVEPDGTVVVGPAQAGGGLLSRKSELRELRVQIDELESGIAALEAHQIDLRVKADAHDGPIRTCEAEIETLSGTAGTLRDQLVEQREKQRALEDQLEWLAQEARSQEAEFHKAEAAHRAAAGRAAAADREAAEVQARLAATTADLAAAEEARDLRQHAHTDAQVSLGRLKEQATAHRSRRDSLDTELKQRRIDGVNLASAERSARARLADSRLSTLRATAAAAAAYADKDARERGVADLAARRDATKSARDALDADLRRSRASWKDRHDAAHGRELAAQDLRTRRDAVARRISEDYGVDLAAGATADEPGGAEPGVEPGPEAEPEREIADLRRKIEKLGSVNLEAVAELADLERRAGELRGQHDDLADARRKLQEIIDQINTDSRRLFADTLSTVRGHFQEMFRKLFGGGQADIILEDESDVLESGIEITARPPGKELRKISLLSGGEKALTAVALLLAIFRSRPSPFCLLDEVDAAMDEANTHRLATALAEFADRSQFIVITHKKRTMAVADVLYGVTMQESGVSKQVSVRFEDWPEDVGAAPVSA